MLLNPKKSDNKVTASALQSNEHLIIKNHAATTHRSLGKGTDQTSALKPFNNL